MQPVYRFSALLANSTTERGHLMAKVSQGRVTTNNLDVTQLMIALSEGTPGVTLVLGEMLRHSGIAAVNDMYTMYEKRLCGCRITELFNLCGRDVGRFVYHVQVELPNQETGAYYAKGHHAILCMSGEFKRRRSFGKPGSFWALEHPPTETNYQYPIW